MPLDYTCPHCKVITKVADQYIGHTGPCANCNKTITISVQQLHADDTAGMRMLMPINRSAWAIAAGYLGLISVLTFPAPFALACGIMAVRDIRKHEDRHGMGRAIFGIVMGVLGTAVLLFAAVLYSIERMNR